MKLLCIIPACALAALATAAFSQDAAKYPARPIRMIVPFAPGGGLDITTGLIGQKLEMFQRAAGIKMIHVPYKGIPPAVTDVIGGHVTMLFTTTISAAPHIKAGRLRAVAITSARRQPSMPEEMAAHLASEIRKWHAVFKEQGIKAE